MRFAKTKDRNKMGARVFHPPPAIRVYEWVEITEALYHGSIADPAIRVYEWVEILICCY